MHGSEADFLAGVSTGLGLYYLLLCAMNWLAALYLWRLQPHDAEHGLNASPEMAAGAGMRRVYLWLGVGGFFLFLAPLAFIGAPFPLWRFAPFTPWLESGWTATKVIVNILSGPVQLTVGSLLLFSALFFTRRWWVRPAVAWGALNLSLLAMGVSMTDPNFTAIVAKPDNVPIVGLVFLLGFFTWVATSRAVANDDRARQGLPPLEKLDDEKILVWPDLVYTELICMILLTAFLLVWGIALQAPLEEEASSVKTPNPSKAPWYFLGLQEMLVYFDPWMAGVVLPSVVILGLMAIPYLDFNKQGNGYYTIEQRKFSYLVFQFGFLELWIVLIILGTFLRGPNWNFFGPFEFWDTHKVAAQNNVDLSQYFWVLGLNQSLPKAPPGSGGGWDFAYILIREAPGIVLTLLYFALLPPLMAATIFRGFFVRMGFIRYMVLANLLLLMGTLPLKMLLRWTFNLKYIISIPEYFLNL
jgi:Cytochrome b(C-terminal)/b6/petD